MQQRGIVLSSQKVIENWTKITENPIVDTHHNIVPNSVFVSYQTDMKFDIPLEPFSNLTAFKAYKNGCEMEKHSENIDNHIAFIYPLRSRTKGLKVELKEAKASEKEIAEKAKTMLLELLDNFKKAKEECDNAIKKISDDFHDHELWEKGIYSDFYVDNVCNLFGKLFIFGEICPTKTALSDDLSCLNSLTKCLNENLLQTDIRIWLNTPNAIQMNLMDMIKDVSYADTKKIFKVFWHRISFVEENELALDYDTKINYLLSFLFLVNFYMMRMKEEHKEKKKKYELSKLDSSVIEFLNNKRKMNPSILMAYDLCLNFDQLLFDGAELIKDPKIKNTLKINLPELLKQLKESYENLVIPHTDLIAKEKSDKKEVQQYVKILFQTLKLLNESIYSFKHLIVDKHNRLNPDTIQKDEEGNIIKLPCSQYEMAIKAIDDSIKESMAHFIAICCQLRNVILRDLPTIENILSNFIESCLQDFVVNQLDTMLYNSARVSKYFADDVNKLRDLIGHFNNDETKSKKSKEDNYIVSSIIPNISIIQILRTQLQSFINPENKMMSRKLLAKTIYKDDLQAIQQFLYQSEHWNQMLNLESFIEHECDESILYFQEFCIDVYQNQVQKYSTSIVYFPITTSIPYVLTEYIISHSSKHELIELLYYPLSIYDSAALRALNYFGSRTIFEEIKAESQISIMTICNMIADFAFDGIKMFVFEKFHEKNNSNLLENKSDFEEVAALKIASVLQQNQLFLLGNHIDVKILFSKRLNELFLSNLSNLITFISQFGILGIFIFSSMINILHDAHNIFLQYDILLDPFENILLTAMSAESPNTFNSMFLDLILRHLKKSVIRKYSAQLNPFRLYPTAAEAEAISQYLNTREKNIPPILKQTTTFVSINHFKELIKIIGTGPMYVILTKLYKYLEKSFLTFVDIYSDIKGNIIRIPDLPLGSGSHKSYDRYDGAYRTYLSDPAIKDLFFEMQTFGNIIIISHMLDSSYSLFRLSNAQAQAFIFMLKKNDIDKVNDDFYNLFDQDFQSKRDYFNKIKIAPSENEVAPPFSRKIMEMAMEIIQANIELFNEQSTNILDFPSLTGFSSIWSVLEFLYILKEVHFTGDIKSTRYGGGVLFCAAAIINLTNQYNLSKILSIGSKIENQRITDIVSLQEEILTKLVNVYRLVRSIFDYAISSFDTTFKSILYKSCAKSTEEENQNE